METAGVKTVRSTFHVVLRLLYGGLFISNLSKMLKFAATHREIEVSAY